MILVGGENLIDFLQEDGDGGYPVYRANPGGSPFNTAMAIGRQDAPVGYLTPISSDSLGQLLRTTLVASGVDCRAALSDKPTSLAVVSLVDGQPSYQFYREDTAERQVTSASLRASLPDPVTCLQLGSLCLANGRDADDWADLATHLSASGIPVTFDPNIRPAFIHDRDAYFRRFQQTLTAADLVKLSDEDIEWLYPGADMHDAARRLFEENDLGVLVLTQGGDGAVAFTAAGRIDMPAAKVPDLVDTVGAGDTFMATLIAQLHHRGLLTKTAIRAASQEDITDILRLAARAAAINCGRKGCNPPTLAELGA